MTHMPMTTARETVQSGAPESPIEKERLETLSDLGNGAKREPELGRRAGREEKERERERGRTGGEEEVTQVGSREEGHETSLSTRNFFPKLTAGIRSADSFDTIGRFLPSFRSSSHDPPPPLAMIIDNNNNEGRVRKMTVAGSTDAVSSWPGNSRSRTINPKV